MTKELWNATLKTTLVKTAKGQNDQAAPPLDAFLTLSSMLRLQALPGTAPDTPVGRCHCEPHLRSGNGDQRN